MSFELPFNFLVATSKAVYLNSSKELLKIHEGNGVYFGLTANYPQYYVLARNNFDGTGGGNPNSMNGIIIFNKDFKTLGSVDLDFVKDGHQILYKDSSLYICNSGLDAISKIHSDGRLAHITFDVSFGQDICHYNSISSHNDRWYIAQHRTEVGKDNGGISVYDNEWKFLQFIEVGKHVHNCIVKDGFLWVANSYTGTLVKIDLNDTNNKTEYTVLKGYLSRGLIITDEYLLCGLSEFDSRENRHANRSGRISIFKYPEMEFLDQIIISDCGQINDLLLV